MRGTGTPGRADSVSISVSILVSQRLFSGKFRFLFESGFHVNSLMNLMHNAAMLRSKVTKKARKNSTSKDEKIKKTEKMAVDTASDHPRHPFGI